MFKRGQRARAVAIHLAMRAIVETEDIARSRSGPGVISRAPLRMLGDGLQARNQPLQRPLLPIPGKQCPHHRTVAKLAGRGNNPRIAKPKRRTKPFWWRTQSIGNRVVAEAQLNADFPVGKPEKIRMRLRVIAYQVSTRDSFFHQLWTFTRVSSNQKKCRFCTVPVLRIEQFLSHRWIRPIVKGERQLARGACAAYCTPEELRARMCGAVGGGSSY